MVIYDEFYNIIHTYIYGGVDLNSFQELVATEVATIASLFLVALPIAVVFCGLKWVFSLGRRL